MFGHIGPRYYNLIYTLNMNCLTLTEEILSKQSLPSFHLCFLYKHFGKFLVDSLHILYLDITNVK